LVYIEIELRYVEILPISGEFNVTLEIKFDLWGLRPGHSNANGYRDVR